MKFDDDFEDNGNGLPVIYMALGVSVFIFLILFLVVIVNKSNKSDNYKNYLTETGITSSVVQDDNDLVIEENKRVAADLDIWDMYPQNPEVDTDEIPVVSIIPSPTVTVEVSVTPEMEDGKHTKIKYKDGSEEWVAISDKIEKNNYDFTNLINSGGLLKYFSDGKNVSFTGIDVSRYQKEIDFTRLKAQGIDFVMIRVGSRGYKNGTLTMDEFFETNINNAIEAGLEVGVYFYSQAISVAEAEEEAAMLLSAIAGKKVSYPVAFDMEYVDNDSSRIDTLTKDEKTLITAAFANKIKDAGYKPMIYGDKEWLLKRIDISKFTQSSVWLADYEEQPDYPYLFDMWQYSTEGELYGIDGLVDLDICFVDYSAW